MPNLIKRAGKKIADSLWNAVEAWFWPLLGTSLFGALATLLLFLRRSEHPRLFYALVGASIALVFSTAFPLTIVLVKMIQDRRSGKPNRAERRRVAEILIADKSRIKDFVMICGIHYREIAEGRKPVHIHFAFSILNMSLYSISVDSIDGTVGFYLDGEPYTPKLKPRLEEKEKARNLGFRSNGYFVIEQNFETTDERAYVLNASADGSTFSFNALTITLKGDGLEPIYLRPDITFRKGDKRWLAYYDANFAYIGIAEAEAKIRELETGNASLLDQLSLTTGENEP